jgi:leucyl aminopeptidase (aminopeptidase T)
MVEMIRSCTTPFELNAEAGDLVLILTDSSMDPFVWQAIAAAAKQFGCRPHVMLMMPLPYHQAEPTVPLAKAMGKADICVLATSKAIGHSNAVNAVFEDVRVIYMEEVNSEILTTGGACLSADEYRKMYELGSRVREYWEKGTEVRVTSDLGTDLKARIYQGPRGRKSHVDAAICPKPPAGGRVRRIAAFPAGETACGPEPGSGEGVVVWDTTFHMGLLREPIKLTVHKGVVQEIQGGAQAEQLKSYIKEYGDENAYTCPGEISVGLNHMVTSANLSGLVRTDKKMYGSVHIAMGKNDGILDSKLHIDGVIAKPTVEVDGTTIVERGVIKV